MPRTVSCSHATALALALTLAVLWSVPAQGAGNAAASVNAGTDAGPDAGKPVKTPAKGKKTPKSAAPDKTSGAGKEASQGKTPATSRKGKGKKSKAAREDTAQSAAPAPCYALRAGGSAKSGKRGRCEPQSLTYARCRTGVQSCRIGYENGPLTWYRCESQRGNTSAAPANGSVLILGKNRHGMPTGHIMVVEKAEQTGPGRWRLVLSHTNYDRRCHLETNIETTYDQAAKTLDVHTGAWKAWGKGLPVSGFILD